MKLNTKRITLENVDAQFCSDWLKGELRRLLRKELALAHARGALTAIASNHKPALVDFGYWYESGIEKAAETCAEDTRQAREALTEIGKILEGK